LGRRQPLHSARYRPHAEARLGAAGEHPGRGRQNSRLPENPSLGSGHLPMRICVLGSWHLGTVTAAGLAELGHRVVGVDFDAAGVAARAAGVPPVFEPGLEELLQRGLASGNLRFASPEAGVPDAEVVWAAIDTPVNDEDEADADWVIGQIERALLGMN